MTTVSRTQDRPRPALCASGFATRNLPHTKRNLLQAIVLLPVVRWFCRPLRVEGNPPEGPAILAANHAGHADTAIILAALPHRERRRLSPAAAEDYFFSSRLKGALVRLLTSAFPFPRRGHEGIRRAGHLLDQGRSVLLFPEGTRSTDGSIATFKCGIGHLAGRGFPVIPVAIRGARDVLPKGRRLPRRAGVSVAFGAPRHFADGTPPEVAAKQIEADVRELHRALEQPEGRPTLHDRAARFAASPAALTGAFAWGVAEALWLPVVPDFFVASLALAAPRRALPLALAATAGSVTGGTMAYVLGPVLLPHAPLVFPRMIEQAGTWLGDEGAAALWRQPLSGIPYKVFALQAEPHASFVPFALVTAAARGARICVVGIIFGSAGVLLRRIVARGYGVIMVIYAAGFTTGLARVAGAWR